MQAVKCSYVRLTRKPGLDPEIEAQILRDNPDQADIRKTVAYWNFLPPDELDSLLRLYSKVSNKTLRISKVFGIEGRKLLTPDDDYEALKDFNHAYEGEATAQESMHLEFQQLLTQYPDLEGRLSTLPLRVFSGKKHPTPETRAVFFCYALPAPPVREKEETATHADLWTEEAGFTKWYLYDLATEEIIEESSEIIDVIRCDPDTPRQRNIENNRLSEIRALLDKHIKNTYLKQVQAPIGVKPILKAWMELS
jgi:hypothetical protein